MSYVSALRRFALLGMGPRRKLLYRDGELLDALTGQLLRSWPVAAEEHEPDEYRVRLRLRDGAEVLIWEDAQALWLTEAGQTEVLSEGEVRLPRFEGHPHAGLLRRLHHEMLVNLVQGAPLPNLFVYSKPWYRDAAMVAMCLEQTGNLNLIAPWVAGLCEPYDRNNAGHCEPDNLGQVLYLIGLCGPADHPLVPVVLEEAQRRRQGDHLTGLTDGAEHPVYQTKWLKYGLRALGLEDRWQVPEVYDAYSALFWMDYRQQHAPGPRFSTRSCELYPYLGWAECHFHGETRETPDQAWPLTWEAEASEADYPGMALIGEEYVRARVCVPHTWHAAEMFLYFWGRGGQRRPLAGPS